jgi:thioredoxin reductase (NADPH)
VYDLIIIGLGPAGLTASIYASRYRLKNLLVGKQLGGTITLASRIENYPGFLSISGMDWAREAEQQAKKLGSEIIYGTVGRLEKTKDGFRVYLDGSRQFTTKSLIIATGSERRKLGVPGEYKYLGRGVSYCTNCDAPLFQGKTVALIGGADAAVSGAVHTAEYAKKVYIIYRRDKLRAEPIWVDEALRNPKIEPIYNTNVTEIFGDGQKVTGVKLDNPYQNSLTLPLDGIFIEIGSVPGASLAAGLGVELDKNGFVKVNERMETNLIGVFAAGDLTDKAQVLAQMITACAQGAVAAASAYKFLKGEAAPKILGV